ncbi:hypothetical protein CVIRNUC_002993 [Coccomyxa viridis]|uniref:Uncharacterized protein n=1 Tax=Coccomyxa viridis TaxID=1274662 RepID=A0AAV1I1R8_9CHLO|nr:hypothetical protein CVIRNUC_002993 [Coccomyxa viridis]
MPRQSQAKTFILALLLLVGNGWVQLAQTLKEPSKRSDHDERDIEELQALTKRSADGVIHFNPQLFDQYAAGRRRPYSLIFFLTAAHLQDKSSLGLRALRKQYGLLAKEVQKTKEGAGKVFFAELEFKESQALFHRLNANTLPWIVHVSPGLSIGADGPLKIKHEDVMRHDNYGHHIWKADDMAAFLLETTGIKIDKVEQPSFMRSRLFPPVFVAAVLAMGFLAYNLYNAPFMKNLGLWVFGVLVIYWFSVSGGMHNIIRGVPMYYPDQSGQVKVFMPSNQGQLGAEGFIMGSMYLSFGLSVAALTFAVPKLASESSRRYAAYACIFSAAMLFRQIVSLYTWKTGYRWRTYF